VLSWVNGVPDNVWNYTNRNLSYFDYATQAIFVWNNSDRNLTYFDMLTVGLFVWNTTARNLSWFDYASVWNYSNRNLSWFDWPSLQTYAWNYSNRNLTWYPQTGTSNLTAAEVWNNTDRNLTYMDFLTLSYYVWNSSGRNLTYFDMVTQAYHVWNASGRNLTWFDWTTLQTYAWNYTNRNLTFVDWLLGANYTWNHSTATNISDSLETLRSTYGRETALTPVLPAQANKGVVIQFALMQHNASGSRLQYSAINAFVYNASSVYQTAPTANAWGEGWMDLGAYDDGNYTLKLNGTLANGQAFNVSMPFQLFAEYQQPGYVGGAGFGWVGKDDEILAAISGLTVAAPNYTPYLLLIIAGIALLWYFLVYKPSKPRELEVA